MKGRKSKMVLHKSYPDENEMQQPEQTISQNNENHRLCRGSICPYTLRMALVGGWFQVDIGSPGTQVHIPWQERHPVLKKARYVQRALPPLQVSGCPSPTTWPQLASGTGHRNNSYCRNGARAVLAFPSEVRSCRRWVDDWPWIFHLRPCRTPSTWMDPSSPNIVIVWRPEWVSGMRQMGWKEGEGVPWRIMSLGKGNRIDDRVYESGSPLDVVSRSNRNGRGSLHGLVTPCIGVAHACLQSETWI